MRHGHPEKQVVYIDETGIDKYIYRENVRAKRGVKVYTKIKGRKYKRLSVVAGKCDEKIIAPMTYEGTADSNLFECWFRNCLCPEISGNIVVLDNASIHRKSKLSVIAAEFNITLLFLPPYSPDLNEIEKFWAWLKKKLRSILKDHATLYEAVSYCFQVI